MIHMYKTPEYEAYEERLAKIKSDLEKLLNDVTNNQFGTQVVEGKITMPAVKDEIMGINLDPVFLDIFGLGEALKRLQ